MKRIGNCLDCNQEKPIFGIKRCRNCYSKYKESLAPKKKCECSPNCQISIPSYDESGNPRKYANDHLPVAENNPNWKGGGFMRMGYKWIYKPDHHFADKDGYVAEHRYVYEKYHKCSLLPWAIIHHKNEIKTDNRPENLEVWSKSIHQNIHNPRKGYRKDLSGRICLECGSDKTQPSHNGQPHWCRHPITKAEWICETCYRRLVRNVRQSKRRINVKERICVKCGTNKSENNMGYLTWRNSKDGLVCKVCFDKHYRMKQSV